MASKKKMVTKDGRVYYKISVSRGYGLTPYTMSWYWPDGWSEKAAMRELDRVAGEFETRCKDGEVMNRAQRKEKEEAEAAEAAKLKTLQQYVDGVFLPAKEQSMSRNGIASYRMYAKNHILPFFGSALITEITSAMVTKRLLDFQREGHKYASTIKLYNILNGIFKMAFLDDTISVNPMLKVIKPVQSKDERAKDDSEKALTVEQTKHLIHFLESEPLKWRTFAVFATDTGMRRGEILGLHWSDIDMKTGVVTVRRNLQYTSEDGVYETSCKNGKIHQVDIGTGTIELLRQLKAEQANSCVSKYVFTQDGSADPMFPTSPTRYFAKLGKRCGIPGLHPHTLRHTMASISILNGADVVSVSARLGHSDTSVTLRMYAHANEESIRKAGQTARDALGLDNKQG